MRALLIAVLGLPVGILVLIALVLAVCTAGVVLILAGVLLAVFCTLGIVMEFCGGILRLWCLAGFKQIRIAGKALEIWCSRYVGAHPVDAPRITRVERAEEPAPAAALHRLDCAEHLWAVAGASGLPPACNCAALSAGSVFVPSRSQAVS